MAQETVKEFETVEKERTVHYCDSCGRTTEDLIEIAINPQYDVEQEFEIVDDFEDEDSAMQAKLQANQANGWRNLGYALARKTNLRSAQSAASVEYCDGCIQKHFGMDIPKDEKVQDIKVNSGEVIVETTKEITTIWPQIHREKWDTGAELGWKGKIVLWPMVLPFSLLDYVIDPRQVQGNHETRKGYIAASLGGFIWITTLFLIATMIFGVRIMV